MRVCTLTEGEAGLLEQLADQVIASTTGTEHPWHKLAVSARKALRQNRPRTAEEQAAGTDELGADARAREQLQTLDYAHVIRHWDDGSK